MFIYSRIVSRWIQCRELSRMFFLYDMYKAIFCNGFPNGFYKSEKELKNG